jgi:hypothetical protein
MPSGHGHDPRENHLLASLSAAERADICPHLQLVAMRPGKVLYESKNKTIGDAPSDYGNGGTIKGSWGDKNGTNTLERHEAVEGNPDHHNFVLFAPGIGRAELCDQLRAQAHSHKR